MKQIRMITNVYYDQQFNRNSVYTYCLNIIYDQTVPIARLFI